MSPAVNSPTAGPRVGDVIAGKYKLQRALGEGGMGRVFLARHEITGRPVAIKVVATADAMTRKRLLGEARAMGRLSHPNVVGVLDMGEWEGAVFLVMEYVHGKTLSRLMKGEPFPPERALELLLPACSGVAAAHMAGILHRDLKPDNLFVCTDRDGQPITTKVLDFGVAKALDEADGLVTDTGVIIGTPRYMAPEQIEKDRTLDERTDIYALGLILYELLVGKLPYASGSLRSVMLEILKGDFAAPHHLETSVPVELSKLVLGALSLEPDDRPATVEDFARSLEPFSGGQHFEAPLDVHTFSDAPDSALPESIRPARVSVDDTTAPSGRSGPAGADALDAPADGSLPGDAHTDTLPSTERPGKVHARDGEARPTPVASSLGGSEAASGGTSSRLRWVALAAVVVGGGMWWAWASERGSSGASETSPAARSPSAVVPPVDEVTPAAEPAPEPSVAAAPSVTSSDVPSVAADEVPTGTTLAVSPSFEAPPAPKPSKQRQTARAVSPRKASARAATSAAPPPAPRPKTDNRDPWAEGP